MQGFVTNGVINGKIWDEWSILDIHAAEEIAGDDVEGGGFRVGVACGMLADAADETPALHFDVDVSGYEELDAAAEGVDVDLLVLGDDGLAQVHADAAAESIESGTVEGLAVIHVLVAAVVNRAADALAVLADGQRALEPLVWIAAVAVNDGLSSHVQQQGWGNVCRPGLAPQPIVLNDSPQVGQFPCTSHNQHNSDNRSWFHNHISFKRFLQNRTAKVRRIFYPSKFLG